MIPILRRIAATALLLGALVLPNAGPAQADDAPIATGAVFNNPRGTTAEQDAVKDHIIGAIDNTASGRLIRAALYALTDQDYTDALVSAYERGVNVRVVLDYDYSGKAAAQNLISVLGTDTTGSSWVTLCGTEVDDDVSCLGTGTDAINHNKFFTFSRVGATAGVGEDVVIQTSANQTAVNTTRYWNNAYTVVGNTPLYTAYADYFAKLAAKDRANAAFITGTADTLKYYFFPQQSGDVVAGILDNVICTGNSTTGTSTHKTIVRVAAFALYREAVADRLAGLAGEGCSVQIVYTSTNAAILSTLSGSGNIKLRKLNDGTYLVHSKYLLVEGNYAGHPDTKWTFTGSHNLDDSSLRENDEALLRIDGATAHDAYAANFDTLLGYSTAS